MLCFNSIKVQLELDERNEKLFNDDSFNSIKVQLELEWCPSTNFLVYVSIP